MLPLHTTCVSVWTGLNGRMCSQIIGVALSSKGGGGISESHQYSLGLAPTKASDCAGLMYSVKISGMAYNTHGNSETVSRHTNGLREAIATDSHAAIRSRLTITLERQQSWYSAQHHNRSRTSTLSTSSGRGSSFALKVGFPITLNSLRICCTLGQITGRIFCTRSDLMCSMLAACSQGFQSPHAGGVSSPLQQNCATIVEPT